MDAADRPKLFADCELDTLTFGEWINSLPVERPMIRRGYVMRYVNDPPSVHRSLDTRLLQKEKRVKKIIERNKRKRVRKSEWTLNLNDAGEIIRSNLNL